jgi:hypothetical protein
MQTVKYYMTLPRECLSVEAPRNPVGNIRKAEIMEVYQVVADEEVRSFAPEAPMHGLEFDHSHYRLFLCQIEKQFMHRMQLTKMKKSCSGSEGMRT